MHKPVSRFGLLLAFLLVACLVRAEEPGSRSADGPMTGPSVQLENGWVRAVPPVSRTSAAYLTITSSSSEGLCLVGASSPIAGSAMLHDMSKKNGKRQMRHIDRVHLEPGESVTFAPGGKHIMLFNLKRVPREGEQVTICLHWDNGQQSCVPLPVQKPGLE